MWGMVTWVRYYAQKIIYTQLVRTVVVVNTKPACFLESLIMLVWVLSFSYDLKAQMTVELFYVFGLERDKLTYSYTICMYSLFAHLTLGSPQKPVT